ncbi:MAG: hypothetical protein FJ095_11930 [Deltaproteobacteria bacterium]|nr:hypothetical protein [Deltaproteobacteria bacterium]
MNAAVEAIDGVVFRILRERRSSPPRDDLQGTLLAVEDDVGALMSEAQLRDEASRCSSRDRRRRRSHSRTPYTC